MALALAIFAGWLILTLLAVAFIYGSSERREDHLRDEAQAASLLYPEDRRRIGL